MRSDTRRNMRRLITAAGEVMRTDGRGATMQAIAARAEISVATAYRYFSSVDQLMAAYVVEIVTDLGEFTATADLQGAALFEAALDHWVHLVVTHGPVMVELRSSRGLIERLQKGDELMRVLRDAWRDPIEAVLRELELAADDAAAPALFLLNILVDPREILDLHDTVALPRADIVAHITAAFTGALSGWCSAATRSSETAFRRSWANTDPPARKTLTGILPE